MISRVQLPGPFSRIPIAWVIAPTTEVGTQNITPIDYHLASMMAYVVVLAGLTYVSVTIVDQRERKVLRRYRATPLRPLQVLGAAMTGGAVTVALEVAVLAIVSVIVFGARAHGSCRLRSSRSSSASRAS